MNNLLLQGLSDVRTVAIGGHLHPDGDCVGSCMGLYNYIQDNYDIKADVYLEPIAEAYQRAKHSENIISSTAQDKVYDLFITLDCGDKGRLGEFAKYFDTAKKTICIDHHISNQAFADANEIRPEASSTCEVLFDLMDEDKISLDTANCLYMGIMCDTGCFKHSNTREHTMMVTGKLISKGVNCSKMIDEVFFQKTFLQNQLLGRCLINSQLELDGKCIMSIVSQQMLASMNAVYSDLEGVIDQLRVTKDVEVAVLMTEKASGEWKLSMRSCEYVDVAAIAAAYGGGGHVRAAGATVLGKEADIVADLLLKIKEQLVKHD